LDGCDTFATISLLNAKMDFGLVLAASKIKLICYRKNEQKKENKNEWRKL
jgi:hypothetical protein